MEPILVKDAQLIAEARDYDQIVIIGRKVGKDGGEHVTTYGRGPDNCRVAAMMGDKLKDVMQWPARRFHMTAELADGEIQLTLYETNDAGPMIEWSPARTFPIDEPHATELLGTLAIALQLYRGDEDATQRQALREGLLDVADIEQAVARFLDHVAARPSP